MADNLKVGEPVVIKDGSLKDGLEGSVWTVDGDDIGIRYFFMQACRPPAAPRVFNANDLERGGAGPCKPPQPKMALAAAAQPELDGCCETMEAELECADANERCVYYAPDDDEVGIVHPSNKSYYKPIQYCPWCGAKIGGTDEESD